MLAADRWLMAAGFLANGLSVNTAGQADLDRTRDLPIAAKKNLLAYDDTTFYSKLISGQAALVHAWDGWCNYGIGENPKIKFKIPKEGSDVFVDTMVVLDKSKNKEAAHKFLDWVLRADSGKAVTELVLYKTPNAVAMAQVKKSLGKQYPNLLIPPKLLLTFQTERDLGKAQPLWSRTVSEIVG